MTTTEIARDRADYEAFQREFGFDATSPGHCRVVEDLSTQTPFPDGFDWLLIAPSEIAGLGMFSRVDIEPDADIGPAVLSGKRTPLGRYMNHSRSPNTRPVARESGDKWMVARRRIPAGEELTVDYRKVARVAGFVRE